MDKNYLIYPCKTMRITQNYNGKTSHLPHTTGSPKDYPIDEGCKDSGSDGLYCPCDEVIVKRIFGIGTKGTNTLWIQSTHKVYAANGKSGIFSALITHPNDSDLKKLKVGDVFKRYELICHEGTDGATANHLHISAGLGDIAGNGWMKNSKGKWVLTTTGSTYKPEHLFYIDPSFTKVISKGGLNFKNLPKVSSKAKYTTGNYKVNADLLYVRTGAGTQYPKKKFNKLSISAQTKIRAITNGVAKDGYVRGLTFTVTKVSKNWGKTGSGWVCLDYCEKI